MSPLRAGVLVAGVLVASVLLAGVGGITPEPARAQPPLSPWRPAGVDSVGLWALEARTLLSQSAGDSIGPNEARAFRLLDRITRRHFERLGSRRMAGARGVLAVFDTLRLEVDFAQDAELPQFVAVTYLNPNFAGHAAATYVYWWRGEELRSQPFRLTGGRRLEFDVWWTSVETSPYEAAIVDYPRTGEVRRGRFTFLRLSRQADFWGVIQAGRQSLDLGGSGPARLVDLNHDAVPEVVAWVESAPDPRFENSADLPPVLSERIWARRNDGFQLLDRRTVPGPFATFVLFLRALENAEFAVARTLAMNAAVVTRARALRLGSFREPASWRYVRPLEEQTWRDRMRFRYGRPHRPTAAIEVRMKVVEGHWLIEGIESLSPTGDPGGPGTRAGGAVRSPGTP
jgi:hypothetical protein